MIDAFSSVPWVGVAAATLAYFVLGAAWFTPLFGKTWDRAVGVQRTSGQAFGPLYYLIPFFGSLVLALAIGVLVAALGLRSVGDAVVLGLVVGIGFSAGVSFTNAVMPVIPRPLLLGAVTGGYHVVGSVLAAVIIVLLA